MAHFPSVERLTFQPSRTGHIATNPELTQLRRFISAEDPQRLRIGGGNGAIRQLVSHHNRGLAHTFYMLKVPQDVHAELWVYKNSRDLSEQRWQRYREGDTENTKKLKALMPQEASDGNHQVSPLFFFDIPGIVWNVAWKEAVLPHTDFGFSKAHYEEVKRLWHLCWDLATLGSLDSHPLIARFDDYLAAVQFPFAAVDALTHTYRLVFSEFVRRSSRFFPPQVRPGILQFYGIP